MPRAGGGYMWIHIDVKSPGHGRGTNYSLASFADTRGQPLMRDCRVHDRGPLSFSFRPAYNYDWRLNLLQTENCFLAFCFPAARKKEDYNTAIIYLVFQWVSVCLQMILTHTFSQSCNLNVSHGKSRRLSPQL